MRPLLVWKLKPSARYLWFGHVDAHEEDQLSNEEVEAEVFVDGVAVTLQTSEEAEGEETNGQADERHCNTHPGDDGKKKLMDAPLPLRRNRQHEMTFYRLIIIAAFKHIMVIAIFVEVQHYNTTLTWWKPQYIYKNKYF